MITTPSSWDVFEPLRAMLLELAQERSLDALLPLIVGRLAAREDVALARIWLFGPGDRCAVCPHRAVCPNKARCLHLAASAARPLHGETFHDGAASGPKPRAPAEPIVHQNLDGDFCRIPIGAFKVGLIAESGAAVVVDDPARDPKIRHPEWILAERIRGFAGQPLAHRGQVLGVLGVFLRVPITPAGLDVLRILANHVSTAIATAQALAEVERMQRLLHPDEPAPRSAPGSERMGDLVARSAAMKQVVRDVAIVAPTDTTVLIQGESGTGKELVARAVHDRSARRAGPFTAVNCAAIPRDLYESEFFGHARGAFSGAIRDRVGRFEAAEGGTLFLDEIGEMPLELQGKLLRVLQESTYERIGEARPRRADVRILAATNRDLTREVELGRFRQDLYYRLNVFPISVRPLRERREDIAALAESLLAEIGKRLRRPALALTDAQIAELEHHDWPGNVRELRNVLERAAITSSNGALSISLPQPATSSYAIPPSTPRAAASPGIARDDEMRRRERENILAALERASGKIYGPDGAAAILGMKPTTLASRLAKMNLRQSKSRR